MMPPMREHSYFTYIMASRSHTLYIGVTSDLHKRVFQHKWKEHDGFTAKYNCDRLVWFEGHQEIARAITREKTLQTVPKPANERFAGAHIFRKGCYNGCRARIKIHKPAPPRQATGAAVASAFGQGRTLTHEASQAVLSSFGSFAGPVRRRLRQRQ
jgi:predicted GIY-YIG superfamily endonuclease